MKKKKKSFKKKKGGERLRQSVRKCIKFGTSDRKYRFPSMKAARKGNCPALGTLASVNEDSRKPVSQRRKTQKKRRVLWFSR